MDASVAVLCERLRADERCLLEALAAAGLEAQLVSPARSAEPVAVKGHPYLRNHLAVDRLTNRVVGTAATRLIRASGGEVLGAGLAATGNRLDVSTALAAAGVPLPPIQLVCSEGAALDTTERLGYPVTLRPLSFDHEPVTLLDRDVTEAVLEHRRVLGAAGEAVALIQPGAPTAASRRLAVVVEGRVAAWDGEPGTLGRPARLTRLAEATAAALGAVIVGVELAALRMGPVVWEVQPVPIFSPGSSQGNAARTLAVLVSARLARLNRAADRADRAA